MRRLWCGAALVALWCAASPAFAQDRDYCPSRPGLNTPPCTIAPGHVSLETSLVDWTRDDSRDAREDTIRLGDTQLRFGVTDHVEFDLGWTPLGIDRVRDKASGAVDRATRTGDVTLAANINLRHPDGKGFSVALQPYAKLPVGRVPIGAGTWAAGLLLPASFDLSKTVQLQGTAEVDAAANASGAGRHLAYSATVGLGFALTDKLGATVEYQAARDNDPDQHTTQHLAAASLTYMARKDLQFDIGSNVGLNAAAPDLKVYAGIAKLF